MHLRLLALNSFGRAQSRIRLGLMNRPGFWHKSEVALPLTFYPSLTTITIWKIVQFCQTFFFEPLQSFDVRVLDKHTFQDSKPVPNSEPQKNDVLIGGGTSDMYLVREPA